MMITSAAATADRPIINSHLCDMLSAVSAASRTICFLFSIAERMMTAMHTPDHIPESIESGLHLSITGIQHAVNIV